MKQIADLKIEGKKGPFYIKKLLLAEAMAYFSDVEGKSNEFATLELIRRTLCSKSGKLLYNAQQSAKMESDIGGIRLMSLSLEVQEHNDFDSMNDFNEKVEAAKGN